MKHWKHAPTWARYRATDGDGSVWWFELRPVAVLCEDDMHSRWEAWSGRTERDKRAKGNFEQFAGSLEARP
jgi:hypothetical protein